MTGRGVSPPVAVALATVAFFALAIAGLGMASLLLEADVIATPGVGQLAGVAAVALSTAAFGGLLWAYLRQPQPSYVAALPVTVAAVLAYLLGIGVGAMLQGTDAALALAAAGGFATSWFALVLAGAAFVASWSAVALVRTRAERPRWPWERDEPDEP